MSQQPPPPPYGGPPVDGPQDGPGNGPGSGPGSGPGNGPPGGYLTPYPYQGPGRPPQGMSNKAKFWIGAALSLPAMVVAGIITGAGSAVADGLGADPQVGAIVSTVLGLLLLVGFIAAIVAILFILAAGACVVLLVAFMSSYN
jgi:hypothetical protein